LLNKQRFTGKKETYGAVLRDFHSLMHGRSAAYVRSSILGDLVQILRTRTPNEVYVTNEADAHPDHQATFSFVRDGAKLADYRGTLFTFVVHGKPPPGHAHRVVLTETQQRRKRVLIKEFQTKLSPLHDNLAEKFTRPEEVFWPIRIK
jgi:LmbE family N-acetylglucosaminyl deacetylase